MDHAVAVEVIIEYSDTIKLWFQKAILRLCFTTEKLVCKVLKKTKNKGKAYTILNTKGERGDEDRRGINEKRSKVVVSRHMFFTRARDPRESLFSSPSRGNRPPERR